MSILENQSRDFRIQIEPIFEMLTHKKKELKRVEWEALVRKTEQGILNSPNQYLVDIPGNLDLIIHYLFNQFLNQFDVIIIGGGQSGLAVGYYLRRTGLSFIILDQESEPSGSWQHMWQSLHLFSPAQWSSLPGIIMKGGSDYYPTRDEAIEYIKNYENKYNLPVKRPMKVLRVQRERGLFVVETPGDVYYSKALVSATGSYGNPFIPDVPGVKQFKGKVIHSSQYYSVEEFKNMRVAIVGEGNSGAQILAEVSEVSRTVWITSKEPRFLADNIDGRYLFDAASQVYEAKLKGKTYHPPSLGDIVMVPAVKEARERGVLQASLRPFQNLSPNSLIWNDGHTETVDAVIFCTGFKPSLDHLSALNVLNSDGRVSTEGTRATNLENLSLVGYGNWTGFASATLIGVGRSAKQTVEEIVRQLDAKAHGNNG